MTSEHFDYDLFRSLPRDELIRYMTPIANNQGARVPDDDLARMSRELDEYDEYRLVFALELGSRHLPDQYARRLPRYLSHGSFAVRCAAAWGLRSLPNRCICDELIDSVKRSLVRCPQAADWAEIVEFLEHESGLNSDGN